MPARSRSIPCRCSPRPTGPALAGTRKAETTPRRSLIRRRRAMRKVQRSDVLDYKTYNDRRDAVRQRVIGEKAKRRIHLGDNLTFLFESTDTILYQVQEMMRLEQTVRESEIQHEIDTYNQLLGDEGELGCTLLIEIDNKAERDQKLEAWLTLPEHLYLKLEDGSRVPATWEPAQIGDGRLSSVQYL